MAEQERSSSSQDLNNRPARPADIAAQEPASEQLPTYREYLDTLKKRLNDSGFLALLLVDVSDINRYEQEFGSRVYDRLMRVVRELVIELKGRQLRAEDLIALNENAGDIFLIFLMPRSNDELVLAKDLDKVANRIYSFLRKRITRSAFPILHEEPEVIVGTALALRNPLIREERLILRQLQRRIGRIPQAQQTRIAALPIEQLEALGEALLDFTDLADLNRWLGEH